MSVHRHRLGQLERWQRRRHPPERPHFIRVARQPWEEPDRERWLAGLTCPCGVVGCPELRIGLRAPAKAPSAEAWQQRYHAYARRPAEAWAERDGQDARARGEP
jgi:hypothetical protein